jgi:hypothetical protein
MGHGAWSMEHGAWGMEHGAWSTEHGAWGIEPRRGERALKKYPVGIFSEQTDSAEVK